MFSEALRILDANTAQYMVEKLQEEVRETKKELQKRDTELQQKNAEIQRLMKLLQEKTV